ncbi:hypothetical protein [Zhongshania sp.]|uniref:hypothetical protein n=1 Tax=Zhongshania sp. TaxID=1971902 RepID=UPI002625EEAA|nr:hypothetical protein [Zhongshania sp.]
MAIMKQEDITTAKPKSLSVFETLKQGISLLFALQNKSGRKQLMDSAETNPLPILFAGLSAMAIFFLICFVTSQLALKFIVQ